MSREDREVIEMANRPRERMDRMERMAKIARRRRIVRAAMREEARAKKRNIFKRVTNSVGALAVVGMTLVTCIALVVL